MSFHDAAEPLAIQRASPRRASDGSGDDGRHVGEGAAMLHLQRLAGNASVSRMVAEDERSPVLDVIGSGGGRPLDDGVRAEMETKLGADFSDVRLHTDARASASAKAVDAHAYTVGSDVVVGSHGFDPASTDGKRTLAHELTHVVQQRAGPVAGTPQGGGISVSDPDDHFERAASSTAADIIGGPVAAPIATGAVGVAQREVEDEPSLEGPLQRQAAGPEEEEPEEDLSQPTAQRQSEETEENEDEDATAAAG